MELSNSIALAGVIVNTLILIVYAITLFAIKRQVKVAEDTAAQALSASFIQLFPIIDKHHSREVSKYRQFARHQLPEVCKKARNSGVRLKEYDPDSARMVSDIVNYYEAIGMLVEHGSRHLLPEAMNVLVDMVHVSVHDIWEILYDNLDVIHPKAMGTWAGSFERLYHHVVLCKPHYTNARQRLQRIFK